MKYLAHRALKLSSLDTEVGQALPPRAPKLEPPIKLKRQKPERARRRRLHDGGCLALARGFLEPRNGPSLGFRV